ncbi:translin, variant 2 [Coprinopsis cinerea AmutBmut pab1-1]|nr:translin, variant 2 [Coprinopsis cinerea AmutBmut pab1-1]
MCYSMETLNCARKSEIKSLNSTRRRVPCTDATTDLCLSFLVPALLDSVRPALLSCRDVAEGLADLIPPNQFWRWKDMWSNSLRTAVFAAVLVEYLTSRTLASLSQVSDQLGLKEEWKDRIQLAVEDYLHGIISVVNELSRLAVNAVTLGNFEEPLKISTFVKDVFVGFSMLNLKNDSLRRRFDSLKYDLKKIEEVVYDVSLRKLAPEGAVATNTSS